MVILDGFAGRGEYADGTPGSPVLIGQLADRAHSWSNPVDLKVFNIEPDAETLLELERCTAPWIARSVIRNLCGTFQEQLPYVLGLAGQSPLFAFLDPFRPTHLLFQDFTPLLARTAVTELCFVFHTPAVVRILEAVRPTARTPEKNRQGLQTRLTEIFGGDRWHALLEHPTLQPKGVVDCFADELLARGARGAIYVGSHAIWERYRTRLKYHIVFFTRNAHGLRLMNDAFCKEARSVYEQTGRSEQMLLFVPETAPPEEQKPADRMRILQEALIDIGRKSHAQPWKRADLIFKSLLRHFGDFTQSEHLQALKELLVRNTGPRFRPLDGKPTRSGGWVTNDQTNLEYLE